MAENRKVHTDCVNASNPYHECGEACLDKITHRKGRKEKKKSGSFILDAALSFGRKKKGSESQLNSPQETKDVSAVKEVYPTDSPSPQPHFSANNEKVELVNSQSFASSQQCSEESCSGDHPIEKGQGQTSESVVTSGNETTPDGLKSRSKVNLARFGIMPTEEEENEERQAVYEGCQPSPKAVSGAIAENVREVTSDRTSKSPDISFSGIFHASEDSDEEEVQSVISDSGVLVGKYRVRTNIASILQLIFNKYGDIAANCRLESTSMRAYYLECICTIVQDLQSTPFTHLTKSKIKEMLAVLKDVESAHVDVTWLRGIFVELTEAMDIKTTEHAKANCDEAIESTKKELESMMEDLVMKEKAVANVKAQIAKTRSRLRELELESCRLSDAIMSIQSKVERFKSKGLSDEIL